MTEDPTFMGLGDAHYAAIGRVASSWALFEARLDWSIQELAGLDQHTAICMTAQIAGSGRKLDALIALLRLRGANDGLIKQMNAISENARGMAEIRNRIVHDPWMHQPLKDSPFVEVPNPFAAGTTLAYPAEWGPHRFEYSAKRKVVAEGIHMPTVDVEKAKANIIALEQSVGDVMDVFRKQQSSEQKSP